MVRVHVDASRKEKRARQPAMDTPGRIRDVAERLFAAHGIDAVSLRRIAAAARAGNNNSVQYHFHDRNGLIRAICEARLPRFERRRAELFGRLAAADMDDPAQLLRILLLPLAEETDETGAYRWAAFLLAIDNVPGMMAVRIGAGAHAPLTSALFTRLVAALAPLPPELVSHRLRVAFRNFFRGLVSIDRDFAGADETVRKALEEDYLDLAVRTMTAPARPGLISVMCAMPSGKDGA